MKPQKSSESKRLQILKKIFLNDYKKKTWSIQLFFRLSLNTADVIAEVIKGGNSVSIPDTRIHLFEVKSLNRTLFNQFNAEEYEEKIQALKECYKYTAKITAYHFWIPVLRGDNWNIFHYFDGNEEMVNKAEFINTIKS